MVARQALLRTHLFFVGSQDQPASTFTNERQLRSLEKHGVFECITEGFQRVLLIDLHPTRSALNTGWESVQAMEVELPAAFVCKRNYPTSVDLNQRWMLLVALGESPLAPLAGKESSLQK